MSEDGEIPMQISPRQDWAAKRGGMRILPLCHCMLLCSCLGVYRVQLVLRHRDRRMLGSLVTRHQDQGRRNPSGNLPFFLGSQKKKAATSMSLSSPIVGNKPMGCG